jgi:CheY-like chemotaxis protein
MIRTEDWGMDRQSICVPLVDDDIGEASLAPGAPVEPTDVSVADEPATKIEKNEPDNLIDAVFAALASAGDEGSQKDGFGGPSALAVVRQDVPWILCIDDDTDFSDALRLRLENHGVAVARAFNGMDGYRLAFTSPASAILLDYHMPNGRGDYILGRLKDNPVTKNIPVLMITGTQDRVLQRRMMAMGAADFLVKPLDFEDLRGRLASYIDILVPRPSRQLTRAGRGVT